MKSKPSPEFERFNALVGRVISVPKAVIDQREIEYKEQSKPTPKAKKTPKKP